MTRRGDLVRYFPLSLLSLCPPMFQQGLYSIVCCFRCACQCFNAVRFLLYFCCFRCACQCSNKVHFIFLFFSLCLSMFMKAYARFMLFSLCLSIFQSGFCSMFVVSAVPVNISVRFLYSICCFFCACQCFKWSALYLLYNNSSKKQIGLVQYDKSSPSAFCFFETQQ